MKPIFPLFARLLVWLFVNFLILLAILAGMVRLEFGSMENLLLPQSQQEEIQVISVDLVRQLSSTPRSDWNAILARLSQDNRMEFALFDARARLLAGAELGPPEKVQAWMRFSTAPPMVSPASGGPGMTPPFIAPAVDSPGFQSDPRAAGAAPPKIAPPRMTPNVPGFPRNVIRTTGPTRYWMLERLPPEPLNETHPVTLVGMTPALGLSPLLFDPQPWIAVAVGMLILSVLFWFPLAHNLTAAIEGLTRATEAIARGCFNVHLSERRRDEIGRLAGAINRMTKQLQNFVTGQKRFLGDAAHELCSPLVRMEMALALLEERADPGARALLADVQEEVARMRELVNELLNFSKASLGESQEPLGPVNLRAIAQAATQQEGAAPGAVQVDVPADLSVMGSSRLLTRALGNLIRNALRYAGDAGPVALTVHLEQTEAILAVADRGPGVPEADLEKLFDPFYRVDTARTSETGGVGLGLAIVKSCVEACGGTVSAANRRPSGFEVTLRLQRAIHPQKPSRPGIAPA